MKSPRELPESLGCTEPGNLGSLMVSKNQKTEHKTKNPKKPSKPQRQVIFFPMEKGL